MKSKCLTFLLLILVSSCKFVKPFFVKNEKKENRKEKRVERKEEKKGPPLKLDTTDVVKKDSLHIPAYDTLLARTIIKYRNIEYKNFQMKAKMHYEAADQKQNFTVNFRIKKNEVIWASISGFGLEVARAVITPDSVRAVDKFNKKVYLYTYKDLQKLVNVDVDFATLQDIIIGNAFSVNGAITNIIELADISTFFIKGSDFVNQLAFNKSDTTLKQIQLQTMRPISSSSILVNFSDYKIEENHKLSTLREYHIQDVKGAATLSMEINKFEFDKEVEFPFKVPSNYKLQKN
jgi:hypothetical protein